MIRDGFPTEHVDERMLMVAVDDAIFWLKHHPHRDYIDAAYAVTASTGTRTSAGSNFSTGRWPIFVAAVKEAAQTAANLP